MRASTLGPPPLAETLPSRGLNPPPISWVGRLDTGPQLTRRKGPSAAPALWTQFVSCLDSPALDLTQVTHLMGWRQGQEGWWVTGAESLAGHRCPAASVILGWASCGSAGGKEVCRAPIFLTHGSNPHLHCIRLKQALLLLFSFTFFHLNFFKEFIFSWRIIALQCCVALYTSTRTSLVA